MELVLPELRCATKSANLELNEKVKHLQANGHEIFHLAFGQSPFPVPKCFVDALKEHAHRHDYLPVSGTLELRKAIAQFHARCNHGLDNLHPDQILVGTGSKELIFLAMNIFHGDIILIAPGWTTYAPQARLAKKKFHVVQTSLAGEWKVTPDLLTRFVTETDGLSEKRLMVLNNPGNPSGTCYSEEELENLADACRQLNIIVLSDEIYGLLNFKGQHVSLAKMYPEGTMVTTGFSKCVSAGGWRIGYIIVPLALSSFMTILQSAASQTFTCAPAPMQLAVEKGLSFTKELDQYVEASRRILQSVAEFCTRCEKMLAGVYTSTQSVRSLLKALLMRPAVLTLASTLKSANLVAGSCGKCRPLKVGCNVTHADAKIELDLPGKILSRSWENCAMVAPSQGGYYLMPDFEVCRPKFAEEGIVTGKQMCDAILKECQVALLPGSDFLRPTGEFTVRLCFVDFDGAQALDLAMATPGMAMGDAFVREHAPKVAEGIRRLKDFVANKR